jgi:hypothetical protein
MNPRERTLMIVVVAVLVVLGGMRARKAYWKTLSDLDKDIVKAEEKLQEVREDKQAFELAKADWRSIGKQTLSMDEQEAVIQLRDALVDLTKGVGLPNAEVKPGLVQNLSSRSKARIVNTTIKVESVRLPNLVSLMFKLYREPYLVRVKKLRLDPVVSRGDSRGRSGQRVAPKPTGQFDMTLDLETILLPTTKSVPRVMTADLSEEKHKEVPRTDRELDQYTIVQAIFEPYLEPTPERVVARPTTTTGEDRAEEHVTVAQVEPPAPLPPDRLMVIRAVLSSPLGQEVVLENPQNANADDRRVRVGSPLYGGTLIFVHPGGAVSERMDGTRLYHPRGLALEQGQTLTREAHPLVFEAMSKLEQRVAGISRAG